MATLFRALWEDARADVAERASTLFAAWVRGKYPDIELDDGPRECVRRGSGQLVMVRARTQLVDAPDGGRVAEAVLVEEDEESTWTTRVQVAAGTRRWVAVEVRCLSERPHDGLFTTAPGVVVDLLALEDGLPVATLGGLALTSTVHRFGNEAMVRGLAGVIDDARRELPVAVFTGAANGIERNERDRAARAARALAGAAFVVYVPSDQVGAFNDELMQLAPGLEVTGGAARLYLPGQHKRSRHRILSARELETHRRVGADALARILAQSMAARRDPEALGRARQLLRETRAGGASSAADELESEVLDLKVRLRASEGETMSLEIENQDLAEQLHGAMAELRYLRTERARGDGAAVVADPVDVPSPAPAPSEVRAFVLASLPGLVFPEEAARELERLDFAISSASWGRRAAEAFVAMQAYTERARDFQGNFQYWARTSGDPRARWLGGALAMTEGEQTQNNPKYARPRMMPIDPRVDPKSGATTRLMLAHVKVVLGGGGNIPRIFFHDDTRGLTRKMHIGFFGPHDLVPNPSES